jgi:ankyrin repeat protein
MLRAVAGGHLDVVQALAAAGADVNVRTRRGATPLALAAAGERQDIVVLLTRLGARR